MADERWTDETEGLVAQFGPHADPSQTSRARCLSCREWAREVLTALADAGLLLPPGGETHICGREPGPDVVEVWDEDGGRWVRRDYGWAHVGDADLADDAAIVPWPVVLSWGPLNTRRPEEPTRG